MAGRLPPPGLSPTPPSALISSEAWSTLINLAGRQRMLSQRIALLALMALRQDPQARTDGEEALRQFMAAHRRLSEGDGTLPAPTGALRAAYFGPNQGLDVEVRAYAALAEAAITRADEVAALALVARATPLLGRLQAVAELYETSAHRAAQETRRRYGDLLKNIQRVAGEARLISMNARVAAARAGDAGAEFSAVAERLAQVSQAIEALSAIASRQV